MIRVAIVEDNLSYLKAMQVLIGSQPDMLMVYTAEDLLEMKALYHAEPDVVILDIDLPNRSGIEGVRLIKEELPHAGVFMLTVFEDEDKIFSSIKAGAQGYLLKKDPPEKIVEAIQGIYKGESMLNGKIARKMLEFFSRKEGDRQQELEQFKPKGYFISNGPGDPAPMDYAIKTVKQILAADKPLFGICLGHQLLALANDIPTFKMHHGHRGLNHPVKNIISGKSEITTQNHGFGVDPKAVRANDNVEITHVNLNDDSIEGIRIKDKKAFSVQYHPEATPGPHDSRYLFDEFISLVRSN